MRLRIIRLKGYFLVVALMFAPQAFGNLGLSFSTGEGISHITPYRVAINYDFQRIWRPATNWGLNAIWETSIAHWNGNVNKTVPNSNDTLNLMTSGPVFRWQRQQGARFAPFIELGVGLSWLSKTEIGGRRLSLHFQFEDNFGLGARFGDKQQYELIFRLFHYSNASIKRPNSGVNMAMLNFGIWFS